MYEFITLEVHAVLLKSNNLAKCTKMLVHGLGLEGQVGDLIKLRCLSTFVTVL